MYAKVLSKQTGAKFTFGWDQILQVYVSVS